MELSDVPGIDGTPDIAGFISFKLFKDHVKTPLKRAQAVSTLTGFLNYLQVSGSRGGWIGMGVVGLGWGWGLCKRDKVNRRGALEGETREGEKTKK